MTRAVDDNQSVNNSCLYDTFVILVYYIGMTVAMNGSWMLHRRTDGRSDGRTRGFKKEIHSRRNDVCVVRVSFLSWCLVWF